MSKVRARIARNVFGESAARRMSDGPIMHELSIAEKLARLKERRGGGDFELIQPTPIPARQSGGGK